MRLEDMDYTTCNHTETILTNLTAMIFYSTKFPPDVVLLQQSLNFSLPVKNFLMHISSTIMKCDLEYSMQSLKVKRIYFV